MLEDINRQRRRFLGVTALTLAAAEFVKASPARAQSSTAAFGPVQQIDAGELNIGYVEAGPKGGPVAILLHGWPYDIHAFVDVAPVLAKAGYRVIVPHLRGYGTTRFLSTGAMRNGPASCPCRRRHRP